MLKTELYNLNRNTDLEDIVFKSYKKNVPYQNLKFKLVNKDYNNNLCWLTTTTDKFIKDFRKQNHISNFNISLNYLLFWHYYEQCIRAFEFIDKYLNVDMKTVQNIINCGIDDSGNWHTFKQLTSKYGCVPQKLMKPTYLYKNTDDINTYLSRHVRTNLINYIFLKDDTIKSKCIDECFAFLCKTLGTPPTHIKTMLRKDNGKYLKINMSPSQFGSIVFENVNDYCYIVKNDYLVNKKLIEKDYGYEYFNVSNKEFYDIISKQLKDEEELVIGVDCRYGAVHKHNIFTYEPNLYKQTLGLGYYPNTKNRHNFDSICVNHNMLLIDKINNGNMWVCANNYFLQGKFCFLTNEWANNFMLEAIVNKKMLNFNRFKDVKEINIFENINNL